MRRVSYCAIESFGSIFVSLFWSFVNSTVSLEHAKASYGLIIAGAQIGAILGPTLAVASATLGVANLYAFAGCVVGMVWVLMRQFVGMYGTGGSARAASTTPGKSGKAAPSLVEGVYLLGRHPYVAGIFFITCLFEVVVTVLDFEMKVLAKQLPEYHDTAAFARFMGFFGQATNSVSLFFSLVGTSFVIRRLGLATTLLLFPAMLMAILAYVFVAPSLDVFFAALVTVKGLSYALNKPSVEMLYFATSDTIKFKSKSWSDVFGSRGAKAAGSLITDGLRHSMSALLFWGNLASIAVNFALLAIAVLMGRKFNELQATGAIVGGTAHNAPGEIRALAQSDDDEDGSEA
jgi:AAA family ATP:ADP antiporter